MAVTLTILDGQACVCWSGRGGLESIQDGQATFLEALRSERPIEVDLSDLGGFDLGLLQLLLSARRTAEERGSSLSVRRHGYAVREALEAYGLDHLLEEPWFGGSEYVGYFFFEDER